MKSKKVKDLIQKPLRFHHQDIHEDLQEVRADLKIEIQEIKKQVIASNVMVNALFFALIFVSFILVQNKSYFPEPIQQKTLERRIK